MKVLHIFNEIKYSGAEIMYKTAAPLFIADGFELLALSTGLNIGEYVSEFESVGIRTIHRPLSLFEKSPFILYRYFRNIHKLVKDENIDIIHIHRSKHFWFFSLVGFILNIKTVRTIHNVFKHRKLTRIKGIIERWTAQKIFNVIFQTIGDSVYKNELDYYKLSTVRVNNWFNSETFFPAISQNERNDVRQSLKISLEDFVIISTGSCTLIKNHHDIIQSLAKLPKKLNVVYLHLGCGETHNEEMALAVSLGISEKIRFLGNKTDVRRFLIASDLYLMTSKFEGLSIAAIEAMACALPSILYDAPGLRDLIRNDDNGFLIKSDPAELAAKIEIFYKDAALRSEKGNAAHKYVGHSFSIHNGVKEIIKIYGGRNET